jgi:hypothetical protein
MYAIAIGLIIRLLSYIWSHYLNIDMGLYEGGALAGSSLPGLVMSAVMYVGLWCFLVSAAHPAETKTNDVGKMSVNERVKLGEQLIFGEKGASRTEFRVGKAQCTLCHAFFKEWTMDGQFSSPPYGPHFFDHFTERIERLVESPKYRQRSTDTEQPEAFPGSGHATTLIEYLAESNICPSCYVVPGFGMKNSHDRESPMPKIHKPPISLSLDELIAIDTWLYLHDDKEPPSWDDMEKAYRKFIPETEWNDLARPSR